MSASPLRQPVARGHRIVTRRCRKRLVRRCQRLGVLALEVCPAEEQPTTTTTLPSSPGGAFPMPTTTTTTTTYLPPRPTTTTLPQTGGTFVGSYQFVGEVSYNSCGLYNAYEGSYIPIPFTVDAQSGNYLLGTILDVAYDADGEVRYSDWTLSAYECDLQRTCCVEVTINGALGPLPEAASFTYHWECPEDHTMCDAEADGYVYVWPGR